MPQPRKTHISSSGANSKLCVPVIPDRSVNSPRAERSGGIVTSHWTLRLVSRSMPHGSDNRYQSRLPRRWAKQTGLGRRDSTVFGPRRRLCPLVRLSDRRRLHGPRASAPRLPVECQAWEGAGDVTSEAARGGARARSPPQPADRPARRGSDQCCSIAGSASRRRRRRQRRRRVTSAARNGQPAPDLCPHNDHGVKQT